MSGSGGSMANRQLAVLELSDSEHAELRSLAARRNAAQALALRTRIVLACAEGAQNKTVAARLQIDPAPVGKWRRRFVEHRLESFKLAHRPRFRRQSARCGWPLSRSAEPRPSSCASTRSRRSRR